MASIFVLLAAVAAMYLGVRLDKKQQMDGAVKQLNAIDQEAAPPR